MKFIRILAVVPLALISLMNVGYAFGTDPKPNTALAIGAVLLGLVGFVAGFGLARNTSWGIPAALAVGGVNVIGALVALATDSNGAIVGLVVSAIALVLTFFASSGTRKVSVA